MRRSTFYSKAAVPGTRQVESRLPVTRFLRFCLVGGVGFVVDAGVLQLLASVDEWLRFVVANAMGAAVNYA